MTLDEGGGDGMVLPPSKGAGGDGEDGGRRRHGVSEREQEALCVSRKAVGREK